MSAPGGGRTASSHEHFFPPETVSVSVRRPRIAGQLASASAGSGSSRSADRCAAAGRMPRRRIHRPSEAAACSGSPSPWRPLRAELGSRRTRPIGRPQAGRRNARSRRKRNPLEPMLSNYETETAIRGERKPEVAGSSPGQAKKNPLQIGTFWCPPSERRGSGRA
jgi:hypothetical protein